MVGTGANFTHYSRDACVIATYVSSTMLGIAQRKLALPPSGTRGAEVFLRAGRRRSPAIPRCDICMGGGDPGEHFDRDPAQSVRMAGLEICWQRWLWRDIVTLPAVRTSCRPSGA